MNISYCIAIVALSLTAGETNSSGVVIDDESVSLSKYVEIYSEPNLSASENAIPPRTSFRVSEKEVPNLGLSRGTHWFRVEVENRLESQTYVVEAGYPLLDYIDLFVQRENSLEGPSESGDLRLFDTRYRSHRTLNFGLDLEERERVTLYFRVRTQSSVQLPLNVYTESAFGQKAAAENLGFGLFYGSMIVIIFYNIFQWIMIRESIYLQYVIYVSSLCLFQMAINGALFEWFFPNSPSIANPALLFFNFLAWAFAFLFGRNFVQLKAIAPRFYLIVNWIAITCIIGAALSLILPYRSLVSFNVILGLAFPPIFGAMGIIAVKAGQRSAKYFVLAFTVLMVGALLYALKTMTILPSHFITEYAMQIGSVLQIVLLSLALGDQAREAFEQRDLLMTEVLEKTKALSEEATARSQLEHDRADAVEQLKLEAETKVALFSDATHHLNNPLNHITGAREIIGGELLQIHERLDQILPDDDDPDVRAIRKAFRENFYRIAESEVRLDDALSRASNAVSVLRAVSGVDGVGVEPCYFAEIWTLLKERIFIADDNTRLLPPGEILELKVLGAPGLYAQAIEIILEAAQHVPDVEYECAEGELKIQFVGSQIPSAKIDALILKINYLVKVTGANAVSEGATDLILRLPMVMRSAEPAIVMRVTEA